MLEIVVRHEDKWKAMVANMGCPLHLIDDIVQDMYLKVGEMENPEKIKYGENDVNHFYIYLTLRTCLVSVFREEKGVVDEPLPHLPANEPIDIEREKAFDRMWNRVTDEISKLGSYGAKLTNTYFKTDISIRSLAEGSGISATSLYHSIRAYREFLQDTTIGEDWEDYCNEDYEKV